MFRIPILRELCLSGVVLGVSVVCVSAQENQTPSAPAPKPAVVRLKLNDGTFMAVDDAWETPQGIWYRQGGISHLAPKDRVKSIDRGTPEVSKKEASMKEEDTVLRMVPMPVPSPPKQETGVFDKPVWIYLVGGARVEADSANESAAGVWYKRGGMSIFIDRSRVDRIELEAAEVIAESGQKERGWSTGNGRLDALVKQNGVKYGVDPYLIFLVMEQESHFNTRVVSPKGARGLMQLMPGTSARFGVRHPHDPAQNISGGTRYLRQLLDRFDNRVDLVLASYNAGEGAVMKFGQKVPPYRETRNYVKQISYRYRRGMNKKKAQTPVETATPSGER